MTTWRRLAAAVLGGALVLSTAACAGTDDGARPRTDRTLAPPPGYVATSGSLAPVAATAVAERQVVSGGGIAFEVPSAFSPVSPLLAGMAAQSSALRDLAARSGLTDEQLQASVARSALLLSDRTDPSRGFADTVAVEALVAGYALPSPGLLRQQLVAQSLTVGRVTHTRTGAGPATTATYHVALGARRLEGAAILVDRGDTVVQVTVITLGRRDTHALVRRIQATLTRA